MSTTVRSSSSSRTRPAAAPAPKASASKVATDTPAPAPTEPAPQRSRAEVRSAEKMLKKAGFNPGKVDGAETPAMRKAVKQFQGSVGLEATGELDDRTMSKLKHVNRRIELSDGKNAGMGQKGGKIEKAERQLARLGYNPGRVDGIYDADTANAVKAFRADQKELKDKRSVLGPGSFKSLQRENNALNHKAYHSRVKDTGERRRADRSATAAARRGIDDDSARKDVKTVQQHLRHAGFDPKRTDGVFDERTAGAVKNFQKRVGLDPTGEVDSRTWKHLQKATLEADSATSPRQTIGERSGAVKNTEKLLKKAGLNPGAVDGVYTEATQRAVDRFRKRKKLAGKGKGVNAGLVKALQKDIKSRRGNLTAKFTRIENAGALSQKAYGHITVNGHKYNFVSGGWGRGNLPKGDYDVRGMWRTADPAMTRDGVGFAVGLSNKYDPRVGGTRTELLIHPDGNVPGTLGCIGLTGGRAELNRFMRDMQKELDRHGGSFTLKVR